MGRGPTSSTVSCLAPPCDSVSPWFSSWSSESRTGSDDDSTHDRARADARATAASSCPHDLHTIT